MERIIGRKKEISLLKSLFSSQKSEFVAVYGRRRVGKTFLVRSAFKQQFTFQVTALGNATLDQQLTNFNIALKKVFPQVEDRMAQNWFDAFQLLIEYFEISGNEKKVIFFDELPWFDTHGSGFIQALEHFWNGWASAREDIILIVCGSAASWMINKLINNRRGLHNRVTKKIKLEPFTLNECEQFIRSKDSILDKYQIIQLYMVLGGIPFYWDEVLPDKSAHQNIHELCFTQNGVLRTEFPNIFSSLFKKYQKHELIIDALAQKASGLTREEIIELSGLPNAGSTSRILLELEESGFIRKYIPFGRKTRNSIYQLSDFYSLFYYRFIKGTQTGGHFNWLTMTDSPTFRVWSGYSFEQVCLSHILQIKHALGIAGVQTFVSTWRSNSKTERAQVDLVIDRRDQVVNLCEMKFSVNPFVIDKNYAEVLRNKVGLFKQETATRKSVFLTMITTFGLKRNSYSTSFVQNDFEMYILFLES